MRVTLLVALLVCLGSGVTSAQQTLSYADALDVAMESSPSLRQYALSLERSEASLLAAQARLKSRFSLSITPMDYSKSNQFNDLFSTWYSQETKQSSGTFRVIQPVKWTDGVLSLNNWFSWRDSYSEFQDVTSETYTNNLYLNFEQPVFTYNRTQLELKGLRLDLERQQLSYSLQLLSLEQRVMQRFFDVYQQKMQLEINREEEATTRESYEIMQNKVDAGLNRLDDLYQAELNLANAVSSVQNQEVALANALDNLKQLIGLPLEATIDVDEDVSFEPVAVDLEQAIGHGLAHRQELRQRQMDIINAEDNLTRTGAENEFRGTLNVAYGTIGNSETFDDIYQSPDRNQQFVISFEIPLFDWGARDLQIQAARAAILSSEISLEDEAIRIRIAIRQAFRNLENQVTQIDIARQNVRNSQLTYEINLEKYSNGDLTAKDLDYYQTQLSRARLNEVASLINYKLGLLDMKIQSLWDFENNRSVVP